MSHRKYKLNENYFEDIDTEEKAYWLGFLYADGCVSRGKMLTLELSTKDEGHIKKFLNCINSEHPITRKEKNLSVVNIGSKKMVSDLINYGCTERKSLTLDFPKNINKHLIRHFIRGYFDGDGCISNSNYKENRIDRNPNNIKSIWTIKFVGTEKFLKSIVENLNLPVNKILKDGKNAYQLKYGGSIKPFNVIHSFYNNSNMHMDRKYKKYLELKKVIDNKITINNHKR